MTATATATVGVVGAGAWGTALALVASRAGSDVLIWARDDATARGINEKHRNPRYLPDVTLPAGIEATSDPGALAAADVVLVVVPAQTVREVCRLLLPRPKLMVLCAKGLEAASGALMSEVVGQECPKTRIAALSGPSFAGEVAAGLPTAMTLGCACDATGRELARTLSNPSFRIYWTDDVTGVEIGGAIKNVLSIAAGIVVGRGLGDNARAALITRGLAELGRLGAAMGGRRETLMGLSGLGDLMLSATSSTSRNTSFGIAIGGGADPLKLRHSGPLAEGAWTAGAVRDLAARHDVDMPICTAVADIVAGQVNIDDSLETLMARPLKTEAWA